MRYLNELGRDFEWRRGAHFRTLEELTRDFERRKAQRVLLSAAARSPESPPVYAREQLLSVLAALPKELKEAGPGICCLPRVPSPAGSNRCLDAESSTHSQSSSAEGESTSTSAHTRPSGSKLIGEEVEGCPSTASGGEPSEGGSLDSEEPWLAETAMWESLSAEGAGWEKMPLGMQYSELWYPSWGYWDPESEQSWCVDCSYADPGCVACDYADASSLPAKPDLFSEPRWSGTRYAVEA